MANGTDPSELVNRSFLLPVDQFEALRHLAGLHHRTFSGEMRAIVEEHLAANADTLKEVA